MPDFAVQAWQKLLSIEFTHGKYRTRVRRLSLNYAETERILPNYGPGQKNDELIGDIVVEIPGDRARRARFIKDPAQL